MVKCNLLRFPFIRNFHDKVSGRNKLAIMSLTLLVLTGGKNILPSIILYISFKPLALSSLNFQYLIFYLFGQKKSKT